MISPAGGRPWVLAFVADWTPPREHEDDRRIRAQLRGLGAILIVIADAGVWSFRPDDDAERFVTPDAECRELAVRDPGPGRAARSPGATACRPAATRCS